MYCQIVQVDFACLYNNRCAYAVFGDYVKHLISDTNDDYQMTFSYGIRYDVHRHRFYVVAVYNVGKEQMQIAYSYLRRLLLGVLTEEEELDINEALKGSTTFLYVLPQAFCSKAVLFRMLCSVDARIDVQTKKSLSKQSRIPYAITKVDVYGNIVHVDKGDSAIFGLDADSLLQVRISADVGKVLVIEKYEPCVQVK